MGDLGLQRSERRGLSSFLAEHKRCDAGFDIQRHQGPRGLIMVTCNGCGEMTEYPAAPGGFDDWGDGRGAPEAG